MNSSVSVRLVDAVDIPQITSILNHYIQSSVTTFRTDALSQAAVMENYISIRDQGLPYIVAVAGNLPASQGYCHTVEITIFVHPEHHARGIGSALMNEFLSRLKNPASLPTDWSLDSVTVSGVLCVMALGPSRRNNGYGLRDWYIRWGFEEVGTPWKRVGFKFGI
ncbi:hypothetical protein C8R43DRAFT_1089886 [Mycena crocata]|nr:hypothetical protein C8R43DRAFT_1089886 [Mycena crocata]